MNRFQIKSNKIKQTLIASLCGVGFAVPGADVMADAVDWNNDSFQEISAIGNGIIKTGSTGWLSGEAISTQTILGSESARIEYGVALDSSFSGRPHVMLGFNDISNDTAKKFSSHLDYGLLVRYNTRRIRIHEQGKIVGDVENYKVAAGDRFRVEMKEGKVVYSAKHKRDTQWTTLNIANSNPVNPNANYNIGTAIYSEGGKVVNAELTYDIVAETPNIIVIYADDMNYDSVSAYNDKTGTFKTTAIDQLANEGMRFTKAHATAAICSPSRYSLMTGRYHWRTGKRGIVGHTEEPWIEAERLTVPGMLQTKGYDTHMIGKWHLGWNWPLKDASQKAIWENVDFTKAIPGGPVHRGFDSYFGDDVPNWPPFTWFENDKVLMQPTVTMPAGGVSGDVGGVREGPSVPGWQLDEVLPTYVDRVKDYLGSRKNNTKPFFLYFSLPSPHTPVVPSAEFLGASGVNQYVDFLMQTDAAIGELLNALEQSGKKDNTIIIFSSDNGIAIQPSKLESWEVKGVNLNVHFKGKKYDTWEAGHRMPMIVSWPGKITPNSVSDEPAVQTDIFATLADIVGYEIDNDTAEDSLSLLSVLKGRQLTAPVHKAIIHTGREGDAISKGNWKLFLETNELYNLSVDVKESNDISENHPERVQNMKALYEKILSDGRTRPLQSSL